MKYVKYGMATIAAQNINANCYKCAKTPTIDEACQLLKIDKKNVFYTEEIEKKDFEAKILSKKTDSHNNSENTYYAALERGFKFSKVLLIGFTEELKIDNTILEKIPVIGKTQSQIETIVKDKCADDMKRIVINLFHKDLILNNMQPDPNNLNTIPKIYMSKK